MKFCLRKMAECVSDRGGWNGGREWRGRFAMKKRVNCSPKMSRVVLPPFISFFLFPCCSRCHNVNKLPRYANSVTYSSLMSSNWVSGRHSQGPPFPASVVIFIMLMLLRTKEVLINKKLG